MTNNDDDAMPTPAEPPAERGPGGRFAKGNRTSSKGGRAARGHVRGLLAAVRDAATPEDVTALLAKLRDQALAGDVQANLGWQRRVLGPERAPTTPIELPLATTAAGLAEAVQRVVAALAAGDLEREQAGALLDALRAAGDAELLQRLERQVEEVERRKR